MDLLKIFVMVANYFHDLATAVLAANIVVVWAFAKYVASTGMSSDAVPAVFGKLSKVTYAALAWVLIGGALRAYWFMDFEWNPAVGKGQVSALVVKHILLVTLTAFGIIMHLKYQRKYGRTA